VGDEVVGWNPFISSLIELADELEILGIVCRNSTASYVETAGVGHVL
jgi:hypothetical protein